VGSELCIRESSCADLGAEARTPVLFGREVTLS
jgi:hypothetical protein